MEDFTLSATALLYKHEPDFITHLEEAARKNGAVTLHWNGLKENKDVVYACLWLAWQRGIMLIVMPDVLRSPLPDPLISKDHSSK